VSHLQAQPLGAGWVITATGGTAMSCRSAAITASGLESYG
jgi:hypothetical protein